MKNVVSFRMRFFTVELNLVYVSDLMKFLFSCYHEDVYAFSLWHMRLCKKFKGKMYVSKQVRL